MEKILAGPNNKGKCLIKWEGWTKEHNTWETADHIATADLQEYERLQALKAVDSDDDDVAFSEQISDLRRRHEIATQRLTGS